MTAYEPVRFAARQVDFGAFWLRQEVEVVPQEAGTATRLSLIIETAAQCPFGLLLPLMRPRFRTAMERSVARIAALVEPPPR